MANWTAPWLTLAEVDQVISDSWLQLGSVAWTMALHYVNFTRFTLVTDCSQNVMSTQQLTLDQHISKYCNEYQIL